MRGIEFYRIVFSQLYRGIQFAITHQALSEAINALIYSREGIGLDIGGLAVQAAKKTTDPILSVCRTQRVGKVVQTKLLHEAVEGRARIAVRGLLRSSELKWILELRLSDRNGIKSVKANPVTGTLLVKFDAEQVSLTQIVQLIESAVAHAVLLAVKGESVQTASELTQWHSFTVEDILDKLETSSHHGLKLDQVIEQAQKYGTNRFSEPDRPNSLARIAHQFDSLPVLMLAGSAVLSAATGAVSDAILILGVVLLNGGIGYATESHTDHIIHSLISKDEEFSIVVRGGVQQQISANDLVVGDIILLRVGQVPADARLLEVRELTVDESALTGESIPVGKTAEALPTSWLPLAERRNMIFRGTVIVGGSGRAVVIATGSNTELGRVHKMATSSSTPTTPMQKHLETLGKQSATLAGAVCFGVFVIGTIRGEKFLSMLKSAITLAIAAVPEGLPTIGTTTLALGVKSMERKNMVFRRLDAVEALGAIEYVCLDKTGTLTTNKMQVQDIRLGSKRFDHADFDVTLDETSQALERCFELRQILLVASLCSEARFKEEGGVRRLVGSPTEAAIVSLAAKCGIQIDALDAEYPRRKIRYRTEQYRFMFTCHDRPNHHQMIAVKGSPEDVLKRCYWYVSEGKKHRLSKTMRLAILADNKQMADGSLRVLGVAYQELDSGDQAFKPGLVWLGLIGMKDPPRQGMRELIAAFHEAGIHTTMMTGDQEATALAIGKELGINGSSALCTLDATYLDALDEETLKALSRDVQIFSRVNPSDKLKIVRLLQKRGKVVAMTGDGINDSPALKAADVGIAMGGRSGSKAARDVADAVITDDNLSSMLDAICEGRTIRHNLKKVLHFLLATNLSEVLIMFASLAGNLGQALSPKHLLWINLITDVFPALALALEPSEAYVMHRPPANSREPIFSRDEMRGIVLESTLITAGALYAYSRSVKKYGVGSHASTIGFLSLTTGQILHTWSARSDSHSLFGGEALRENRFVWGAMGLGLSLQVLAAYLPGLNRLLGNVPITKADALQAGYGAIVPFLGYEFFKALKPLQLSSIHRGISPL